jgi:transcriptional accessory protein Tex/SPT6
MTSFLPIRWGISSVKEAADTVRLLCQKLQVEAIAIGNGTASRETETFVRALKLSGLHSYRDGQRKRRLHLFGL